jgi:hypothetical protein
VLLALVGALLAGDAEGARRRREVKAIPTAATRGKLTFLPRTP